MSKAKINNIISLRQEVVLLKEVGVSELAYQSFTNKLRERS